MPKFIVYYIIIVHSIIIGGLLNTSQQYLPMLAYLYASPFLFLVTLQRLKMEQRDIIWGLLILSILSTRITHPESFRLSTVMYSILFIIGFVFFSKMLQKSRISYLHFSKFIRFIIFAYFFVLVIQQISLILGLPVLNGILYQGLKLNALAIEPSNIGQILPIFMLFDIKMVEHLWGRKMTLKEYYNADRKKIGAAIYVLLTCGSVACIFVLFILSLYFFNKRNLLIGILSLFVLGGIFLSLDLPVTSRIRSLIPAVLSMDASVIYGVDSSASARIGPYIIYANNFNIFNINTWLGYGCDYAGEFMTTTLTGVFDGNTYGIGGLINFMLDYGLIAMFFFLRGVINLVGFRSFELFFFVVIISILPFNHYILWLYMYMMYALFYYKRVADYKFV